MTEHEYLLQRLVDGELQAPARLALMQEAEAKPALWREIALSFIESQELKDELGELFAQESHDKTPARVVSLPARRSPWSWSWTMAAGVIAMLALGFLLGSQVTDFARDTLSSLAAPQDGESPALEASASKSTSEAPYRLRVEAATNDEGQSEVVHFPAYDEAALRDRFPIHYENGWEIGWRTNMLTTELQDGRRLFVPVSMPSVHYQGQ